MLSHNTLSKFRGELQRRKSDRLHRAKREQKADNVARCKSEKEHQRRRRDLLGSNYFEGGPRQTIDPNDEFFQAPDEFEDVAQRNHSSSFQFNQVCAEGGAFPELSSSLYHGRQDAATASTSPTQPSPATMAPSTPPQTNTSWGSRNNSIAANVQVAQAAKSTINHFPSLSKLSVITQKPQSKGTDSNKMQWGSR